MRSTAAAGTLPETRASKKVRTTTSESIWVVVRLRVPFDAAAPGSHPVVLEFTATGDTPMHLREKTTFLMPR